MADITKCSGEGCTRKSSCYRYLAPADDFQSMFIEPPFTQTLDNQECEHYWEVKQKEDEYRDTEK